MRVFLPYPPSANQRLTVRKGGKGLVNTARYRAWKSEASWVTAMAARDQGTVRQPYRLDAVAMPPKTVRVRDLDNLLKATCDALKEGGAVVDDSLCHMINIAWGLLDDPGILCVIRPWRNLLLPEAGEGKPLSEIAKSLMPRRSRRAATIPAATSGDDLDMRFPGLMGSNGPPSSTPADGTVSPRKRTKRKA
jgi:Holliday junction resolvase RusA-like endonuclease